jgi:excisionase family DNA binding protein
MDPKKAVKAAALDPAPRQLVPVTAAAAEVGCHPRTIRRRIADGTLTGYRVGPKLVRVDLNEVKSDLVRSIPTTGGA